MTQKAKADKVKSFSEKAFQRPFEDLFSCADTCAVILAIGKYVQKVHLKVCAGTSLFKDTILSGQFGILLLDESFLT